MRYPFPKFALYIGGKCVFNTNTALMLIPSGLMFIGLVLLVLYIAVTSVKCAMIGGCE